MTIEDIRTIHVPMINAYKHDYIKKDREKHRGPMGGVNSEIYEAYADKLPSSLKDFYGIITGYCAYWEGTIPTRKEGEKTTANGIIDIQPLEDLFDERVFVKFKENRNYYIEGEEGFSKKGEFLTVDYIEDICVGVFSKENNDEIMYFHDFGVGFYPLKVNFEGYLELAFMARGYLMWPYVLVYLEYGQYDDAKFGMSRYEDFTEDMPLLFPDFKMEEFIALYESLKIKK